NVNLAWDASSSTNVGGYKISYGQSSGNYSTTIDAGNKTNYVVSGLQESTKYFFAVKAYDSTKTTESVYSNEINVTVPITTDTTPVTADFTTDKTSGNASLVVNFTPVTGGTITSWKWDFAGSYTPSITNTTAQAVTVTYPTPGTYSVSLTATGPNGSVTASKPNLITVTSPTPPPPNEPDPNEPDPNVPSTSSGLVAAYGFEETSGSTVVDATGNGNNGTIKEAVQISNGKYGKALKFDGVNDWVTVNNSSSLALSTSMTLEAWVYPESITTGNTVILKEKSGGAVYNLYASEDNDGPVSSFSNNNNYYIIEDSNPLPLNQWSHLVSTYDGQYQRLYVNGAEVASRSQTGTIEQSTGVLRIGGNSVWGEFFKGYIDEVRIYNRALTATEINYNLATSIAGETNENTQNLILGNMNEEPWVDTQRQGRAQAFRTVAEKSGAVNSLQVYLDASTTATKLVAGIYSNKNGQPSTLIAQGSITSLQLGAWNSVTIPNASVTAGQKYWIAILGPDGQIGFLDQYGSGQGKMVMSSSRRLTSLPNSWASLADADINDASMSVYGTGN
ncbi:MAG: LamG-like jellyroll fold domain-containing protein, partial [Methylobacter sp.]